MPSPAVKKGRSKSVCQPTTKLAAVQENQELDTSAAEADSGGKAGAGGATSEHSAPARRDSCPGFFGVRSYLHHFYEQRPDVKNPQLYEEFDEYRYLIGPKEKKRTIFLWKLSFWSGIILLTLGTLLLLFGYLTPLRIIIVGQKETMEIVDTSAIKFNQVIQWAKILGFGSFAIGGTLVTCSLILPTLIGASCFDDSDKTEENTPFKVRIVTAGSGTDDDEDDDDKSGARSSKGGIKSKVFIPATETIKQVQPSLDEEEDETAKAPTPSTSSAR